MRAHFLFALLSLASVSALSQPPLKRRSTTPLAIGWHDEMNATENWKPLCLEN